MIKERKEGEREWRKVEKGREWRLGKQDFIAHFFSFFVSFCIERSPKKKKIKK